MKYSYKILKEYIDGEIEFEKLIEFIDILGLNPAIIEKNGDVIFELEIPANRGDLLSLIGIAREIIPFTKNKLNLPPMDFTEEIEVTKKIKIENKNDCPYYSCRIIKNIEKIYSPPAFIEKIKKLGFSSSFFPVDISNFVMAETGQPIHIFDLDRLNGEIIIRRAKKGEKIKCLDEKDYSLDEDVLVIADSEKPVAIAGIIGGINSCVTEKTKNILIESAVFNPVVVRRGSKKLGIVTEASLRFEKGISTDTTEMGMERTAYLIKEMCGGKAGKLNYSGKKDTKEIIIKVRQKKIEKVLGIKIEEKFIEEIFRKTDFQVKKEKNTFLIKAPSYRKDIKEDIDIIEEIARYRNYSSINEEIPSAEITPTISDKNYEKYEKIKNILVNFGFFEIITLSLISEEFVEMLNLDCIKIENPLSSNFAYLRPFLSIQMLDVFKTNISHQVKQGKFFEIGKVYFMDNDNYKEEMHLSFGLLNSGNFYHIKGVVEELLKQCGVENLTYKIETNFMSVKKGAQAILYNDTKIGEIFIPEKEILEKFEVEKEEIYIAELYIEKIVDILSFKKEFKKLHRFPFSKRDFSFILPFEINWEEVVREITSGEMPVEKVEVFDIYKGKNVPSGKISVSFSVYFRSEKRTLTAEEIEKFSKKIISIIEEKFNGELRGERI